jgi:hypothetical protein
LSPLIDPAMIPPRRKPAPILTAPPIAPGTAFPVRTAYNVVEVRGEELSEPVLWIGKQWAVTSYGVEERSGRYTIDKSRLWEGLETRPWEWHMAEKTWVDIEDFRHAMAWARSYFESHK